MDYFIFNLYFFATWILIAVGIIAIIIKLPAKDSTKSESEILTMQRVSKHSKLLISFMEELTTKDIELIKQYKHKEVVESVKRNL